MKTKKWAFKASASVDGSGDVRIGREPLKAILDGRSGDDVEQLAIIELPAAVLFFAELKNALVTVMQDAKVRAKIMEHRQFLDHLCGDPACFGDYVTKCMKDLLRESAPPDIDGVMQGIAEAISKQFGGHVQVEVLKVPRGRAVDDVVPTGFTHCQEHQIAFADGAACPLCPAQLGPAKED